MVRIVDTDTKTTWGSFLFPQEYKRLDSFLRYLHHSLKPESRSSFMVLDMESRSAKPLNDVIPLLPGICAKAEKALAEMGTKTKKRSRRKA